MQASVNVSSATSSWRSVLDTVRILETREVGRQSYEVCATGRADYDENSREMRVDLDALVRRFEMRGKDEVFRPAWLPHRDSVRTHVSLEEAPDAAKEIFGAWAQKVRKATPSPGEWQPETSWLHMESGATAER